MTEEELLEEILKEDKTLGKLGKHTEEAIERIQKACSITEEE